MKAHQLLSSLREPPLSKLDQVTVTPLFLWWLSRSPIFKLLIALQPQPLTSGQLDVLYTSWQKCVKDRTMSKTQPPKPKEKTP